MLFGIILEMALSGTVKIVYFQEKEILGTAGGVKNFAGMLDESFL